MDYRISREKMVRDHVIARNIGDENVIQAMLKVPRHYFVEEALRHQSYTDRALPIGEKQTISQPYIVALMIQALELHADDVVLEIGGGSGYQTAILAEIVSKVYSLERIASLIKRARRTLDTLRYLNVVLWQSDGSRGWKEYAPYDAIIVSAAAPDIPEPLLHQLADNGRLVAPVGNPEDQELIKIVRQGDSWIQSRLGGCRFVKLVGHYGWNE